MMTVMNPVISIITWLRICETLKKFMDLAKYFMDHYSHFQQLISTLLQLTAVIKMRDLQRYAALMKNYVH